MTSDDRVGRPDGRRPAPPMAMARPQTRVRWGEAVVDEYHWLSDPDDPDVLAHLEAENSYTEQFLEPVAELRRRLYDEIKARIRETDLSVPVIKGSWAYFTRTSEGEGYPRHVRCPVAAGLGPADVLAGLDPETAADDEQILLDESVEAAGLDFFDVGVFEVSPDHRFLLWGFDGTGDERFTLRLRDLVEGTDRELGIDGVSYGSAWAMDSATFFYVRPDHAERPYQVWRHQLDHGADADELVYSEDDERFFVGVGRDVDDSFLYLASGSKITDEVWVIPADQPTVAPRVVIPRSDGVEYSLVHHGQHFVVLTNQGAENFRVILIDDDAPEPASFEAGIELIPGADEVTIADLEASDHVLVLYERTGGSTRIRLRRWDDGSFSSVPQPEDVSTVWAGANVDPTSRLVRYGYSSLISPTSVMTYHIDTGERELLKQQEVGGGFDTDDYVSERLWATSQDGASIPVSIVRRRDRKPGPGPCVLYGYGAYEVSIDPGFSSARLSLLDRGFVFAIAHARGGGEMGRHWYRDGKLANKPNTFHDMVAAARHLIDQGLTAADQLVLRGGSAGGLMVGATINQAPELFAGAVAEVPFVDALNTMLNPDLPLTVTEWEEWGNPEADEAIYHLMRGYSPYENVAEVPYPSILAVAGLNDTRVGYWEAAKWIQRLRSLSPSGEKMVLWTDLGSGHGGPSDRYDKITEEARVLAYILLVVGCED